MPKYVYGKSHPLVEPAWWMVIDKDSLEHAEASLKFSLEKTVFDPHYKRSDLACQIMVQAHGEVLFSLPSRIGWFMNPNGGMCPKMYEIQSTIESKFFPKDKVVDKYCGISFHKWPNGTHWYARKDGQVVEDDDKEKWDTKEEAQIAALNWLKKHGLIT